MKGSKQAKGSKDAQLDSKSAKGSKDAQNDSKSAKSSKEAQGDSKSAGKSAEAKSSPEAKDGKQGEQGEEEQDDSTTAKGKEGKKSYSHGNNAPGLSSNALEEEVETEMANDSMNWMEITAASAIAIVVTALVIALVMRTKQKNAANEMETEMGVVTHVADMSTSQVTAEVSA